MVCSGWAATLAMKCPGNCPSAWGLPGDSASYPRPSAVSLLCRSTFPPPLSPSVSPCPSQRLLPLAASRRILSCAPPDRFRGYKSVAHPAPGRLWRAPESCRREVVSLLNLDGTPSSHELLDAISLEVEMPLCSRGRRVRFGTGRFGP